MRALVLEQPNSPLRIQEKLRPIPGEGEILIKVKACGVCHMDIHITNGDWALPKLPLIPGHEVVGEVAGVGTGVTSFQMGDRVGISWTYSACGLCEYCTRDDERFCPAFVSTGLMVDGGFAEYMKAPASHAVPLPSGLNYTAAAPLFCAGLTAFRALKISGAREGDTVAIWGTGGLGQLAIQLAKEVGATVAAVDTTQKRLELARQLGADVLVNAGEGKTEDAIAGLKNANVALIFAPTPQAVIEGFQALRPGGTVVLAGQPPGNLNLSIVETIRKGIRILPCGVGTLEDLCEVLALAASKKVRAIYESFRIEDINEVLERMRNGSMLGRAVIEFPEKDSVTSEWLTGKKTSAWRITEIQKR